MREVIDKDGDEASERQLFARRARVVRADVPDFEAVLAEVDRRAADVSRARAERRGRRVAAASMTVACLAAGVAAWVRIGGGAHTIVAEPDAGVSRPTAIIAADFSADEPGACELDRSMSYASEEPTVCLAPAAASPIVASPPVVTTPPAPAAVETPMCWTSWSTCEPDVTCSIARP